MQYFILALLFSTVTYAKAPNMQAGSIWKDLPSQRNLASEGNESTRDQYSIMCKVNVHDLNVSLSELQARGSVKLKFVSAPTQIGNEVCLTYRTKPNR